jgi:hypothetical protein
VVSFIVVQLFTVEEPSDHSSHGVAH